MNELVDSFIPWLIDKKVKTFAYFIKLVNLLINYYYTIANKYIIIIALIKHYYYFRSLKTIIIHIKCKDFSNKPLILSEEDKEVLSERN